MSDAGGEAQRGPSTWSTGTIVAGRYRLEALLGAGAFGAVFRATDARMPNLMVALKLMTRASLAMPESQARFAREARILMGLRHPATVRVLDAGDAGGGVPYIAFEYLRGRSLEARIAEGPIPLGEALRITMELLGSLEEAHAQRVVHRDVKPANVFLCGAGAAVKLLDFGLAKDAPRGATLEKMTAEGALVGTPEYMAPEQLQGAEIGPSTDLFAVGLVLAEMLTGAPVYTGPVLSICVAKLNGLAPSLAPSIPLTLVGVIQRASAMSPAQRFSSADQMRRALRETGLMHDEPTKAPSGRSGTQIMTVPTPPSGAARVSAMASTAQPEPAMVAASEPKPVGKSRVDPLGVTRPLEPLGPALRPKERNLSSTVTDDSFPRQHRPKLAATVGLEQVPSPAMRVGSENAPASSWRWAFVVVVVLAMFGVGAALAYWRLR